MPASSALWRSQTEPTTHERERRGLSLIDVPGHVGADEMQAVWSYVKGKVWGRDVKRGRKHVAAA